MTEDQIKQEQKTLQGEAKYREHIEAGNKIGYYAYRKAKGVFIAITEKWEILKLCKKHPSIATQYDIQLEN